MLTGVTASPQDQKEIVSANANVTAEPVKETKPQRVLHFFFVECNTNMDSNEIYT